jgi:hypothetical protein
MPDDSLCHKKVTVLQASPKIIKKQEDDQLRQRDQRNHYSQRAGKDQGRGSFWLMSECALNLTIPHYLSAKSCETKITRSIFTQNLLY